MEEQSRLEAFKEFVEMDPNDTFSRYALAMEYMGVDDYASALEHFGEVIRLDADYSAAYFQAAIASQRLGKIEQARNYLVNGISTAEKKRDWHARDEMKAALEALSSTS